MKQLWDLLQENLGQDFTADEALHEDVRALSAAFTQDRAELPADYLGDPELQAAYLAYFVPLNFEKVRTILSTHSGVWPKEAPTTTQRWIDFGAGPGTAVLAALASYKNRYKKIEKLAPVHIDVVDNQTDALNMAELLIRRFAEMLGLEVTIALHTDLEFKRESGDRPQYDLALAANVLNELPAEQGAEGRELLMRVWDLTSGVLFVLEPGHRVSSQRLVRFRERLMKEARTENRVLGPCPHQEKCPVHRTKHWCHFSEPVTDGRLIDLNLRIFKDPRGWLKFSYLLTRREAPLERNPKRFRAIGDLHQAGQKLMAIDLCQPNEKFSLTVPMNLPPELRANLVRGASVELGEDRQITAKAMTKREPKVMVETHARRAREGKREREEVPRPAAARSATKKQRSLQLPKPLKPRR